MVQCNICHIVGHATILDGEANRVELPQNLQELSYNRIGWVKPE